MKRWMLAVFVVLFALWPGTGSATGISADGQKLAALLNSLHVEQFWIAGAHVDWQTGIPTGKPQRIEGKHTHCSAFAASATMRLGVYLLRPPEHSQKLLANAQDEWLGSQAAAGGWNELADGEHAQNDANDGELVVAVYRNHHDDKPGHIAIVRPSEKSANAVDEEGPQVIQAGGTNYNSTSLAQGFANHPAAWSHHEVRYFAHAVDWQRVDATR